MERTRADTLARSIVGALSRMLPACLIACAIGACSNEPPKPRPRNVLLLVADTLRANRLGCYGYARATSPSLDALAERGTLYVHSYSQSCWTIPSMISMMSGVSVTQEETVLPQQFAVIGESLRANGMETAAFLANGALTTQRGFERGFDVLSAVPNVDGVALAASFADWYRGRKPSGAAPTPKPFFAWVHFIDPHQPYTPSQDHDLFHGPRPDQEALDSRWRAALPRVAELSPAVKPRPFEDAASEMVRQSGLYDGEVRAVDDGVERILEALKEGGELDSTLVIFCGDHGEMLFEHTIQPFLLEERLQRNGGLPGGVEELFGNGHRPWYFEDLWNTPLIFAGPGVPANVRRDGLAANLDIYPTILDALDLPRPAWLEGQSLWGGLVPQRERVFAHGQLTSAVRERSGVKLIVHSRRLYMLEGDGPPPVELYDVSSDPMEERDLAQTRIQDVARLSGEIERWRKANERAATTDTTPEQAQALRQMGYAGGDPAAPVPANGGVKRR